MSVFNLIFAVACGCVTGLWAGGWQAVQDQPDQQAAAWKDGQTTIKNMMEKMDQKRPPTPVERVVRDHMLNPETVRTVAVAVARNPSTPAVRAATTAAAIAQAALFLGSILLLMRKNAGRVLSMLALATFIGATIATLVKFPSVAEDIGQAMSSKVSDAPGYAALPSTGQSEVTEHLDEIPDRLQIGVTGTGIFFMVWPVISLLILFASRGIRDACTPSYPRP